MACLGQRVVTWPGNRWCCDQARGLRSSEEWNRLSPSSPAQRSSVRFLLQSGSLACSQKSHSVRLFDSFDDRVAAVCDFVQLGISDGATVLAVATKQTWAGVDATLRKRGVPIDDHMASERVIVLDAHKELDRFLFRDWPDEGRLESTLGAIVDDLARRSPLRIYGEMVDILAERGLHRAAHRLEQLWNNLASKHAFELFCGYSAGHFGNERTNPLLQSICAEHSHVHRHAEDLLGNFLLDRVEQPPPPDRFRP